MNTRQEITKTIASKELCEVKRPKRVSSYFGENTFSIPTMRKHISKNTFKAFLGWLEEGRQISLSQANEIADSMKNWAMAKGATYYTHWFQPMTGMTAEKHDSFISFTGPGKVIGKRPAIRSRPPRLGEHTAEILKTKEQ